MNRTEFDRALQRGIRGLPKADIQRFSEYYAEMLDDRIESGMTEEAAVAQLGDPAAIAAQILSDASVPIMMIQANKKSLSGKPPEKLKSDKSVSAVLSLLL